jgi:hypothetical protein
VAGWALVSLLGTEAAPANGPVDVRALDEAALEAAHRVGRPLLVIVSDPACARCVLDEEEALADGAAAGLLREAFVVARVDRVQRPDLDQLFATAVQWLSGERGYPLVVALLPDGRPYAGRARTGAADRGAAPGLHRFALRAWSDFAHARPETEARAARTAEALARAQRLEPAAATSRAADAAALRGLEDAFDARLGGFGEGESFAPPAALRLLLATLERGENAAARRMLERTLDAVAAAEPEPATLARRALLLEAFARATRLFDSASYRARTAALADGASKLREPDGAFVAYGDATGGAPVMAGWNGLMIGALALSGAALDRPQDLAAARAAAEAILRRLGPPSGLRRSAGAVAPLQDHACLAEGLLRLHGALGGREPRWADEAAALADAAMGRYLDPSEGAFFDSLAGPDAFVPAALPQRLRSGYDGDLPSANGVMAAVLARLAQVLSQPRYADLSRRTLEAFAGELERAPRGMEGLAAAMAEGRPVPPTADPAAERLPSSDVRDGIVLAAELAPAAPRAGQPFVLRLRMTAPPGRYVVAHDPGADDLVGLSVSVPTAGVAISGPVAFPTGRRLRGRWGSGTVFVHDGDASVEVPLRLAPRAAALPASLRARVLFQSCRDEAATCDRPQAVLLEVPLRTAR